MTPEIYEWAQSVVARLNLAPLNVLEVGSYDVNGGLRSLFTGDYYGVDIRPGPGVDEVIPGSDITWAGMFDVGVCTEVMEHDLTFWKTLENLVRAIRAGGYLIVSTCGNGFPTHEYPKDFYRFSEDAIMELFILNDLSVIETKVIDQSVMGVGRKL